MLKELFIVKYWGQQLVVHSYDFFMGLAAVAVLSISLYSVGKMKLHFWRSIACLFIMTLSVPIGARILNVIINPSFYAQTPSRILAPEASGFSLMGGLLLAVLTGYITTGFLKISPWSLGDAVAPGLGIALALMRVGCFLNGCCYGITSSLPWAVRFPYGSPAHKYFLARSQTDGGGFTLGQLFGSPELHPTQLYEMIAALIAAALAFNLRKRKVSDGVPSLSAAIIFTIGRFVNHFLRVQPPTNEIPPYLYPLLYLCILFLSALLLKLRLRGHTPTAKAEV